MSQFDYFVSRKVVNILIGIFDEDAYGDRLEYDSDDLKEAYGINDRDAEVIWGILHEPESVHMYRIMSMVGKLTDIPTGVRGAYIEDLRASFDYDAYKDMTPEQLKEDVQVYSDYPTDHSLGLD